MGTCRALSRYHPSAFPPDRQPRVAAVVWARLGLDNREDAPVAAMRRPGLDIGKTLEEMTLSDFKDYFNSWFYGRRERFGPNGWETLLGHHVLVHAVDGGIFHLALIRLVLWLIVGFADHFSMMSPPFSGAVGEIVADTVARAVAEE